MSKENYLEQIKACNPDKPYIFISYSDADHNRVYEDVIELQRRGYNIWIDNKNLDKTKDSWKDDALAAVSDYNCIFLIFYVSRNSLTSENCFSELMMLDDEDTVDAHGEPIKFICIDVEEIGDIIELQKAMVRDIRENAALDKEVKKKQTKTLSQIIKKFFDSSNERVRIHPRYENERKLDYYDDIVQSLPQETILLEKNNVKDNSDIEGSEKRAIRRKIKLKDGSAYFGELRNGAPHGYGTRSYPHGEKYEGNWVNGKRHGSGVSTYANGDVYEGPFKNDKREGDGGIYRFCNGDVYKGSWNNNKFNGEGTLTCLSGNKYIGPFVDGVKEGDNGVYIWNDGSRYEGSWKNGKRDGYGIIVIAGGSRYEGEFAEDHYQGMGTYFFNNGETYTGNWKNGKRDGSGTLIKVDGREVHQEWKDGELLEEDDPSGYVDDKYNKETGLIIQADLQSEEKFYKEETLENEYSLDTMPQTNNIDQSATVNGDIEMQIADCRTAFSKDESFLNRKNLADALTAKAEHLAAQGQKNNIIMIISEAISLYYDNYLLFKNFNNEENHLKTKNDYCNALIKGSQYAEWVSGVTNHMKSKKWKRIALSLGYNIL